MLPAAVRFTAFLDSVSHSPRDSSRGDVKYYFPQPLQRLGGSLSKPLKRLMRL